MTTRPRPIDGDPAARETLARFLSALAANLTPSRRTQSTPAYVLRAIRRAKT